MPVQLTDEQRRQLFESGDTPPTLVDPVTETSYVLVRAEVYEQLKRVLDFAPAEAYPAIDRAFAEGWDDPKMAEYDRYEEYRP
jgi:hypothetical protein